MLKIVFRLCPSLFILKAYGLLTQPKRSRPLLLLPVLSPRAPLPDLQGLLMVPTL